MLDQMDVSREIPDEELWGLIDDAIADPGTDRPSLLMREAAREQVFHALRGLDVLQELMEDPQKPVERPKQGVEPIIFDL